MGKQGQFGMDLYFSCFSKPLYWERTRFLNFRRLHAFLYEKRLVSSRNPIRLLLDPAMELVQAGKEKRESEWGYSTFSRYFNALGKANFPDQAPIAALPPQSFCRDATAVQTPPQHSVPSP